MSETAPAGGAAALAADRARRASSIAALAFAIGRFSTFGAAGRADARRRTPPRPGFARDMQVHHAQAIEMAMEIYRKTEDDELRVLVVRHRHRRRPVSAARCSTGSCSGVCRSRAGR